MDYLKQHYARLETDELLKLKVSELTDEARTMLEVELQLREGTEDAVNSQTRRNLVVHNIDVTSIAPLWRRLVAGIIDFGGVLVLLTLVNFLFYITTPKDISDLVAYTSMVACFIYIMFRDAMPKCSVGKQLMSIKVLQVGTGEACSLPRSFIRNLLHALGPLDWALALGPNSRRLGDLAAETYVAKA